MIGEILNFLLAPAQTAQEEIGEVLKLHCWGLEAESLQGSATLQTEALFYRQEVTSGRDVLEENH